jgi:hypothetical protein
MITNLQVQKKQGIAEFVVLETYEKDPGKLEVRATRACGETSDLSSEVLNCTAEDRSS